MAVYKQERSDAVVSVRCKSTTLATLFRYFSQKRGVFVVNKSSLVRLALEEFEKYLVEKEDFERCTSLEKARDYLSLVGIRNLNPDGKLGLSYLKEGEREANFPEKSQDPELEVEDMEEWQKDLLTELTEKQKN